MPPAEGGGMEIFMNEKKEVVLACENLVKIYANSDIETKVLKGINLKIYKGSINLIYGKSGSGKTTLLNLLATLDKVTSGSIYLNGNAYQNLSEGQLSKLRGNRFGFVFQAYNLIENISVKDNIYCLAYINGKEIDRSYYEFLIETLGISNLQAKTPKQLSGGEQQRVAIARAMILKPDIIFADEPTGNLDSENSRQIMQLFRKLNKEYNTTFIIVSHDENLVEQGDNVILLKDGVVNEN